MIWMPALFMVQHDKVDKQLSVAEQIKDNIFAHLFTISLRRYTYLPYVINRHTSHFDQ